MASNTYTQYYADGTLATVRRSTRQGRRPSGLAAPQVVRLYAEDKARLAQLSERFGYLWNENEFIRDAVRSKLNNSVYTELVNT